MENLINRFIYSVNFAPDEEELALMELGCIFNEDINNKIFVSSIDFNPSNSPFIKESLRVDYIGGDFEELLNLISSKNLSYEDFKVSYFKTGEDVPYNNRLSLIKEVGMAINGEANIYEPNIEFGIGVYSGKWFFGRYLRHNNNWHIHDKKPCTYSSSLNYKVARALVNIAVEGDYTRSLIDPCCGVGTVLLEAASLSINYSGCEINPMVGERAKVNLEFFGYEPRVIIDDIANIDKCYDVGIIDLPYGHFNPISREEQIAIISSARGITKRLILVTHERMDEIINQSGFIIKDVSTLSKGKFKRYVTVCI
ncbi:MAG: SAM-dependent methyltransferase [Clostridium sp.]